MKFNEFKPSSGPQLTEEQQVVLDYCKGEITKEDAVKKLSEAPDDGNLERPQSSDFFTRTINKSGPRKGKAKYGLNLGGDWRDQLNKLTGGRVDSRAQQNAQDKATSAARKKGLLGPDVYKAGQAALAATPGVDGKLYSGNKLKVKDKSALAAPPPKDFPDATAADYSGPVAKKKKAPVKATAANTRDYDKTLAMQKKLIAGGAEIDADGLMGPKTRAAMKAAGMAPKPKPKPTPKPTAKPKPMPKRMDPMEPGDDYRKPASDKIPGMKLAYTAKPTAKTPAAKIPAVPAPVPQVPAQKKQSGRGIIGGTVAAIKRSNQRNRKQAAADYKNNPNKKVTIPGTKVAFKPLQGDPNDPFGGLGA